MLLTVARLSVPLFLLSLRSMALGWFHSSLHCHPEQINVTMRKARAALFLRRANSLLESLSDLLYSFPRTLWMQHACPHFSGWAIELTTNCTALRLENLLTTYDEHSSCWLYLTSALKKKCTNCLNLSALKGCTLTPEPGTTWLSCRSLRGEEKVRRPWSSVTR